MGKNYGRALSDLNQVEDFFKNVLHLPSSTKYSEYLSRVTTAAIASANIVNQDTLHYANFRFRAYSSDDARMELRKTIYDELISQKRLECDDDISLHNGGVLPITTPQKKKMAFYVIGLPASGKSEISNKIADNFGAIILDCDYAKRKFPEYQRSAVYGASALHEESSVVIFGGGSDAYATEPSVLQYAVEQGYNIVIPKIGDVKDKVVAFSRSLKDLDYTIHLVLVRLDREEATRRAFYRFIETGRYVPLQLIFDVYGNDPTITFFDLLLENCDCFSSYTMISSNVAIGQPKKLVFASKDSPITDTLLNEGGKKK